MEGKKEGEVKETRERGEGRKGGKGKEREILIVHYL